MAQGQDGQVGVQNGGGGAVSPSPVTIRAYAIVSGGRFARRDLNDPYIFHTRKGALNMKQQLRLRGRVVPVTVRIEADKCPAK